MYQERASISTYFYVQVVFYSCGAEFMKLYRKEM